MGAETNLQISGMIIPKFKEGPKAQSTIKKFLGSIEECLRWIEEDGNLHTSFFNMAHLPNSRQSMGKAWTRLEMIEEVKTMLKEKEKDGKEEEKEGKRGGKQPGRPKNRSSHRLDLAEPPGGPLGGQ